MHIKLSEQYLNNYRGKKLIYKSDYYVGSTRATFEIDNLVGYQVVARLHRISLIFDC